MPAIGQLAVARWPEHVAFQRNADGEPFHDPAPVRIDAGFGEGDAISPHYDSMIAKLIVWGDDRAQALARLDAALAQTHIVGLQTNVAFLRRVVGTRAFATADLDTALIERERAALFEAPPLPLQCVIGGVVAHALALERERVTADPWSQADGWRLHGVSQRRFDIEIGGVHHAVTLERAHGGALTLCARRPATRAGRSRRRSAARTVTSLSSTAGAGRSRCMPTASRWPSSRPRVRPSRPRST